MVVTHNITGERHEMSKEQYAQLTSPEGGGLIDTYTVIDATDKDLPKELKTAEPKTGDAK